MYIFIIFSYIYKFTVKKSFVHHIGILSNTLNKMNIDYTQNITIDLQ